MKRARGTLLGKTVLITGGARGIGAAVAAEFVRRGARVVLADIDETALAATASQITGDTIGAVDAVVVDVSDFGECNAAVREITAKHGRIDIVWANAGIGAGGPVELVGADVWTRVIEVNVLGTYNIVKAALPSVIDARGYVAITASVASFVHPPIMSAYAASKAAVEAFANSLRIEVAHQGVDVGVLHPTWIATDMVRDADAESPAFQRLRAATRAPFNRTYPLESIVAPIAGGFEARRRRICLPGFVRLAYALRPLLTTDAMERDYRKAAPEMRRLFLEQMSRDGARLASLGSRWSRS